MSNSDTGNERAKGVFLILAEEASRSTQLTVWPRTGSSRGEAMQLVDVQHWKFKVSREVQVRTSTTTSTLQLPLQPNYQPTLQLFEKYRDKRRITGGSQHLGLSIRIDPGYGCWPTWSQPEADAVHRLKKEEHSSLPSPAIVVGISSDQWTARSSSPSWH